MIELRFRFDAALRALVQPGPRRVTVSRPYLLVVSILFLVIVGVAVAITVPTVGTCAAMAAWTSPTTYWPRWISSSPPCLAGWVRTASGSWPAPWRRCATRWSTCWPSRRAPRGEQGVEREEVHMAPHSGTVLCEACPCGSVLPCIRVEGRREDLLHFRAPDRALVPTLPLGLTSVLAAAPAVHRFQVTQAAPDAVRVRLDVVGTAEHLAANADVVRRLTVYLASQGLPDVRVTLARGGPARDAHTGKLLASVVRACCYGWQCVLAGAGGHRTVAVGQQPSPAARRCGRE